MFRISRCFNSLFNVIVTFNKKIYSCEVDVIKALHGREYSSSVPDAVKATKYST